MKITFLVHSVDGVGGTVRATLNTARYLTGRGHDVEIVTVFRRRPVPKFEIDPRVRVCVLIDESPQARRRAAIRSRRDRVLAAAPSAVVPAEENRAEQYSALTDRRVGRFIDECDSDVVIGTRPSLNLYLARHRRAGAVAVAQDHLLFDHHKPGLRDALCAAIGRLDAYVTVTESDAERYRAAVPEFAHRIHAIANSVAACPLRPATGDGRVVVAAGRLVRTKRYDLLIDAFAELAPSHPDWSLRIYGAGNQFDALSRLIRLRRLGNVVYLMGQRTPMDAEWVKGSIAAVSSDHESFGMTIVEAMGCGLPVVSTDCDYGPGDIIDDGGDGLLTPTGDAGAFADALSRLIGDDGLRRRMAEAALVKSRVYLPDVVGERYERLLTSLSPVDRPARRPRRRWRRGRSCLHSGLTDGLVDCEMTGHDDGRLWIESEHGMPAAVSFTDADGETVHLDRTAGAPSLSLRDDVLPRLGPGVWTMRRAGEPAPCGRIDSRALTTAPRTLPPVLVSPSNESGGLVLRVRRCDRHAEVEAVDVDGPTVNITGRLYGDWPDADASVVAEHADDTVEIPCDVRGELFALRVPATDLSAGTWRLWLVRDGVRARLARVLDDIPNRKRVQFLPQPVTVGTAVWPYYTGRNNLVIRVEPD